MTAHLALDDEIDDDLDDDEDDFFDTDEDTDEDEDDDNDEDDVETWQVHIAAQISAKVRPCLTSSPELPRLPVIFQLSQLEARPVSHRRC